MTYSAASPRPEKAGVSQQPSTCVRGEHEATTYVVVDSNVFLLDRPVGPGYDKGKAERLRHEVNHQYKCNYFKWASDVKRDPSTGSNPQTS